MNSTRANILVVDDSIPNLDLLDSLLTLEGYAVRTASNGMMALQKVTAVSPNLIILDVNMPGMDGYAVCNRLKANPHTRDIPVIFLSGSDSIFDEANAFRVGGADYMTKPYELDDMIARIESHLHPKPLAAASK